jgi:hypothetical protein
VEIPRQERPHGALGAIQGRRPQTSSTDSVQAKRPKETVSIVQTPTINWASIVAADFAPASAQCIQRFHNPRERDHRRRRFGAWRRRHRGLTRNAKAG